MTDRIEEIEARNLLGDDRAALRIRFFVARADIMDKDASLGSPILSVDSADARAIIKRIDALAADVAYLLAEVKRLTSENERLTGAVTNDDEQDIIDWYLGGGAPEAQP